MLRFSLGIAAILAAMFGAVLGTAQSSPPVEAAVGGPVIIGGDDLTDHGCVDGSGDPVEGWLYMQRALENIGPKVTRANDGSIAALGSADPGGVFCSNAGSAIQVAAGKVGRSVTYYDGAAAIQQFFSDLVAGTAKPAIIWVAGDGASNDLEDDEPAALVTNANAISTFVNAGGGLFSHGSEFGWLSALLPTVTAVCCGSSDDLYFTPDGTTELSPLTLGDINAGPWHNHFEGDLGGLKVLVRSSDVKDTAGQDAAVVIGGAQVTIVESRPSRTPESDNCIPAIPTHSCGGEPGLGISTPVAQPTQAPPPTQEPSAPPPAPTSPGGTIAGVISAPDTGDGSATAVRDSALMLVMLAAVIGVGGAALAFAGVRRR